MPNFLHGAARKQCTSLGEAMDLLCIFPFTALRKTLTTGFAIFVLVESYCLLGFGTARVLISFNGDIVVTIVYFHVFVNGVTNKAIMILG